eukprot:2753745-Alexandrium_andersonii.AAC.1
MKRSSHCGWQPPVAHDVVARSLVAVHIVGGCQHIGEALRAWLEEGARAVESPSVVGGARDCEICARCPGDCND